MQTYTYKHSHKHIHACMHAYMYTYTQIHIYMPKHSHAHIHPHTHIPTHKPTHAHTHDTSTHTYTHMLITHTHIPHMYAMALGLSGYSYPTNLTGDCLHLLLPMFSGFFPWGNVPWFQTSISSVLSSTAKTFSPSSKACFRSTGIRSPWAVACITGLWKSQSP